MKLVPALHAPTPQSAGHVPVTTGVPQSGPCHKDGQEQTGGICATQLPPLMHAGAHTGTEQSGPVNWGVQVHFGKTSGTAQPHVPRTVPLHALRHTTASQSAPLKPKPPPSEGHGRHDGPAAESVHVPCTHVGDMVAQESGGWHSGVANAVAVSVTERPPTKSATPVTLWHGSVDT